MLQKKILTTAKKYQKNITPPDGQQPCNFLSVVNFFFYHEASFNVSVFSLNPFFEQDEILDIFAIYLKKSTFTRLKPVQLTNKNKKIKKQTIQCFSKTTYH